MTVSRSDFARLLREYPPFRRLLLADLVTQVGEGSLIVAFPMLLLEATRDVTLTGLAFSGEILAFGLVSPLAGVWADRMNQKGLMIGANLVRALLLVGLLVLLERTRSLAACMALSTLLGAVGAFFTPARSAFLRRLLRGGDLECALAAEGTMGFLIRLVAPAVVGALLVHLPAASAIWLDLATYLVGAALLAPAWVTGPALERPSRARAGEWREGWRVVLGSPVLGRLLAMDFLLTVLGMAAWATTVAWLDLVLHRSVAENGWLMAVTGLAGTVGTRLVGYVPRSQGLYAFLAGVFSASYLLVPATDSLPGLLVLWFVRGAALGAFAVALQQQIARETPAEVMGRVQAAWGLAGCLAAFLGTLLTPGLLRTAGAAGAFYAFGLAMALVAAWLAFSRIPVREAPPEGAVEA